MRRPRKPMESIGNMTHGIPMDQHSKPMDETHAWVSTMGPWVAVSPEFGVLARGSPMGLKYGPWVAIDTVHGSLMGLPWVFHRFQVRRPWVSHELGVLSHGSPNMSLACGFPMSLQCWPMGHQ